MTRTPVTGMAVRNAVGWATPALGRCGLLHVFNPLSHAATNKIGGLIIKYRISPAQTDNGFYVWHHT